MHWFCFRIKFCVHHTTKSFDLCVCFHISNRKHNFHMALPHTFNDCPKIKIIFTFVNETTPIRSLFNLSCNKIWISINKWRYSIMFFPLIFAHIISALAHWYLFLKLHSIKVTFVEKKVSPVKFRLLFCVCFEITFDCLYRFTATVIVVECRFYCWWRWWWWR